MAVTVETLRAYVGADIDDADVSLLLQSALSAAAALVDKYVGVAVVPVEILDRCYLIVATDLFERRNAPNGIANQQYATVDGIGQAPMRVARDPMAGVYEILRRWVLPW